jgi:voltage-gated potassium channel Kch
MDDKPKLFPMNRADPRPGKDRSWTSGLYTLTRALQGRSWILIGALWVTALALGYAGLLRYSESVGYPRTVRDLFYLLLQLVTLESGAVTGAVPWELEIARFALPALAAITVIQALAVLFHEQVQLLSLRTIRGHIVICGLSRKGLLLAKGFLESAQRVVIIELDEANDFIEQCKARGAIVLTGDATDRSILEQAATHRARCLIAVCDDDGINAEIAVQAQAISASRSHTPLTCIVHIVDPQLCDLLREKEIASAEFDSLRLELLNIFFRGAKLMWESFTNSQERAVYAGKPPRVLVVGLGKLGENLVIHATRSWQRTDSQHDGRLQVTVVDREADWKCEALRVRYPQLEKYCDLKPNALDVKSPEFYGATFFNQPPGEVDLDAAFICLDDDSLGLSVGLTLLRHLRDSHVPIFVRMKEHAGLAYLLRTAPDSDSAFRNLHAFGLLDRTCTPDLLLGGTHEVLARALHEEYVRSQEVERSDETVAQPIPWDHLPEETKESNRRQVDHLGAMLKAVGCTIAPLMDWGAEPLQFSEDEIEVMARLEHERWCADQVRHGWKFAPGKKDIQNRTHPDLLPWENLPEPEKEKNRIPSRELPALLTRVGFSVVRVR